MGLLALTRQAGRALLLVALFLATLELCTRVEAWWRWDAPFWGPYSSEILRTTDAIGTRNRPGARFEKWAINSAGFRGPELRVEKAPGVVRVGIAGASEMFGLYESPDKDVAAQLREQLSTAPGRFEVVNLAAAGITPPRMRELYERWAGRFGFDFVVVYPTPAFYLDVDPPSRATETGRAAAARESLTLRLPDKLWRALRELLPAGFQGWLKRAQIERVRRAHAPDWVWTQAPPDRVALFESDLALLVESIERSGARVILATHANRFTSPPRSGDDAIMLGWIRFYPRASAQCLLDMERQANDAVRRLGRERGLAVVDVEQLTGKDPGYYADFAHFTDAGASRVAAALGAEVRSLAPLRDAP